MQNFRFKRWILCEDMHPKTMFCPNICWLFRPFTKIFNLSEDASRSNSHLTMISDPTPSWFCAIVKLGGTFWPCFCPCTVNQQNSSKDHMKPWGIYMILFPIFPWNPKLYWNFKKKGVSEPSFVKVKPITPHQNSEVSIIGRSTAVSIGQLASAFLSSYWEIAFLVRNSGTTRPEERHER